MRRSFDKGVGPQAAQPLLRMTGYPSPRAAREARLVEGQAHPAFARYLLRFLELRVDYVFGGLLAGCA